MWHSRIPISGNNQNVFQYSQCYHQWQMISFKICRLQVFNLTANTVSSIYCHYVHNDWRMVKRQQKSEQLPSQWAVDIVWHAALASTGSHSEAFPVHGHSDSISTQKHIHRIVDGTQAQYKCCLLAPVALHNLQHTYSVDTIICFKTNHSRSTSEICEQTTWRTRP